MRKVSLRLMVMALLLLLIVPVVHVFAQTDQQFTTVIDLSDGYVISVPDGWTSELDDQLGGMTLSNDDLTLYVLNPVQISDLVEVDDTTAPDDLVIDLFRELYNERPRRRDIEATEFDGREAAQWAYEDDSFGSNGNGIFYIVRLSDDTLGAVDAYSDAGNIDDNVDLVEAIVTSLNVGEGGQTAANDTPAEPCFVSTTEADTVELRVGPGSNRSVMAYMAAGEDIPVIGRFTTDSGDVWYQVDKDVALPDTAANELWVAADSVDETGDCDAVVDASAPPIVPIVNQPPPSNDNNGGGDTGGSTGGGTGGTLPSTGTWTVVLDGTTTASCLNTNTITLATSDVYYDTSFSMRISSVASDGSSLVADGDTFTRQSNGLFVGSYTFDDGSNTQLYLNPLSATSMNGSIIINFTSNGRSCSATTNISASR